MTGESTPFGKNYSGRQVTRIMSKISFTNKVKAIDYRKYCDGINHSERNDDNPKDFSVDVKLVDLEILEESLSSANGLWNDWGSENSKFNDGGGFWYDGPGNPSILVGPNGGGKSSILKMINLNREIIRVISPFISRMQSGQFPLICNSEAILEYLNYEGLERRNYEYDSTTSLKELIDNFKWLGNSWESELEFVDYGSDWDDVDHNDEQPFIEIREKSIIKIEIRRWEDVDQIRISIIDKDSKNRDKADFFIFLHPDVEGGYEHLHSYDLGNMYIYSNSCYELYSGVGGNFLPLSENEDGEYETMHIGTESRFGMLNRKFENEMLKEWLSEAGIHYHDNSHQWQFMYEYMEDEWEEMSENSSKYLKDWDINDIQVLCKKQFNRLKDEDWININIELKKGKFWLGNYNEQDNELFIRNKTLIIDTWRRTESNQHNLRTPTQNLTLLIIKNLQSLIKQTRRNINGKIKKINRPFLKMIETYPGIENDENILRKVGKNRIGGKVGIDDKDLSAVELQELLIGNLDISWKDQSELTEFKNENGGIGYSSVIELLIARNRIRLNNDMSGNLRGRDDGREVIKYYNPPGKYCFPNLSSREAKIYDKYPPIEPVHSIMNTIKLLDIYSEKEIKMIDILFKKKHLKSYIEKFEQICKLFEEDKDEEWGGELIQRHVQAMDDIWNMTYLKLEKNKYFIEEIWDASEKYIKSKDAILHILYNMIYNVVIECESYLKMLDYIEFLNKTMSEFINIPLNIRFDIEDIDDEITDDVENQKLDKLAEDMGIPYLSSGQAQILNLIFSLGSIPEDIGIILVDEPEISLHDKLITDYYHFMCQVSKDKDRQIICSTHSTKLAGLGLKYTTFVERLDGVDNE